MVTKVGIKSDYANAIKDLLELDFDAIEAYEAAINRLQDQSYKSKLSEFKQDHVKHTEVLSSLLKTHEEEAPTSGSAKQYLAQGKVVLGGLIGDKMILLAMISNEIDTNTAYERVLYHEHRWADAVNIITEGLADERRHKTWLQSAYDSKLT
jgi:rubrerythrin